MHRYLEDNAPFAHIFVPSSFFFFFLQIELDIHVSLTLSVSHRLPPGTMGSLDAPTTLVSCSSPKAP